MSFEDVDITLSFKATFSWQLSAFGFTDVCNLNLFFSHPVPYMHVYWMMSTCSQCGMDSPNENLRLLISVVTSLRSLSIDLAQEGHLGSVQLGETTS